MRAVLMNETSHDSPFDEAQRDLAGEMARRGYRRRRAGFPR